MNTSLQAHSYRKPFFLVLVINVVLLVGVGVAWWHFRRSTSAVSEQPAPADTASTSNATPEAQRDTQLAPIQLTPQRMQSIGVQFGKAAYKNVNDEIRVTGYVEADESRISSIQVRFPGWIRKVYVDATYRYVRMGQPLFTIYSPDLVATEQEYLLARQNQQQLNGSTIAGVSTGAASLAGAAKDRLAQWEVSPAEIAKLESTGKVITDLTFDAPASGYITEKNVLPNMYVKPETKLYTVADLSTVWVNAQVFQPDIGKIKPGDAALITVDAYPGKTFNGRIDQILPQVDPNTRTERVRLVIPNPQLKLKPGMYVNVSLKVSMGRQLVVPATAVLQSGTNQVVFMNRGDGNLEPRQVVTGARVGDDFIVTKGLKPNESVVTTANFLIDSESQLQAASGSYVPPPPGAGGTASSSLPSPQVSAELSTEPSPPHKGSNVFRVKLTAANNSPITGAQVTVTFYMPSMPAMGMAAMNTRVNLTDKGKGMYEGEGDLGAGGTWQVTIIATQNGQAIASKHFTVNAEGGM
jgi:Cu(I)/Ag(I) efflux system membrane fusion protein/cobalt-zinc-cadmium efflux system membrane fusion protein